MAEMLNDLFRIELDFVDRSRLSLTLGPVSVNFRLQFPVEMDVLIEFSVR